jgi:hypothetical protein
LDRGSTPLISTGVIMQEPAVDIHGKEFYGWAVYVEGKAKFGTNSEDFLLDMIKKSILEGREIVIKPEHW